LQLKALTCVVWGFLVKYISILLLWLVILTGTWTNIGQEFFNETRELREISQVSQASKVTREPNYAKTSTNHDLEKARDFLSKNNITEAVAHYENGLSNKVWAEQHPREWTDSLKAMIKISDPSLSYELLSVFLGKESVPSNLRAVAKMWRAHAQEWARAESNRPVAQNISMAKNLLTRAEELQSKNPGPVGLILYLRSNALLNEILIAPDQANNQEALLLAGRSAEGLRDRENFRDYYQRCISIDPNSESGRACQQRLKPGLTANHLQYETAD
jgi:hypothetical protein